MKILAPVLLLVCSSAAGMNILPKTKDDHRSFDFCVRRLETAGAKDVPAVLQHLKPIHERYGGYIRWNRMRIGSEDERKLVYRQNARTGAAADNSEIGKDVAVGIVRWAWNTAVAILDGLLPGAGVMLPVVIVLYLYVRYGRRVIRALYADAEKLPAGRRKEVFTSPIVHADFERRRKRGTRDEQRLVSPDQVEAAVGPSVEPRPEPPEPGR